MSCREIINKLTGGELPSKEELAFLLGNISEEEREELRLAARQRTLEKFGNRVYIRGLIEFTNICKNDCYYCGIRRSNGNVNRYRLTGRQIMDCCETGYKLGFRTFVLQGGEDGFFTDDVMCGIVSEIKTAFPDCAVTLSLGERSYESYKRLREAGADRYLLRHETANEEHYARLHPPELSLRERIQALGWLKELGFQTGAGFMVGSPYQTLENLAEDLLFIARFKPQMCGIGPFIPQRDTIFRDFPHGDLRLTLTLLSIIRLLLPDVLLPATTALGSIDPRGRELGILSGANVVMPNLSPGDHRADYTLYDNKICTGDEAAECINCLTMRMRSIGYEIVTDRGDYKNN